jgi:hypothetical protein
MADTFDPYREALVMETSTVWPAEYADWDLDRRRKVEAQLHADPAKAAQIEYERTHTGFCRVLTVTPEDVARLQL